MLKDVNKTTDTFDLIIHTLIVILNCEIIFNTFKYFQTTFFTDLKSHEKQVKLN